MRLPGFSYSDMVDLVYANNNVLYQVFTDQLLIAIFWEETQFNNIKQTGGGSAVGLGQVEPRELPKLQQYGVYTTAQAILEDPAEAVRTASYMLYHGYASQKGTPTRREALKRYAGYYYDKAPKRLALIGGWEACERGLIALSGTAIDDPDPVLNALSSARVFPKTDAFVDALFP